MGKDLKVEGDLKVEKDLKVKDDLHVCGYAKIEHHLEVDGHLNFGQKVVTQLTALANAVMLNSSSGIITTALLIPTGTTSFTVTNSKVHSESVILLSLMSAIPATTGLTFSATNVLDDSFLLTVTCVTAPTIAAIRIGFLIC